jgi:hypothetical protein
MDTDRLIVADLSGLHSPLVIHRITGSIYCTAILVNFLYAQHINEKILSWNCRLNRWSNRCGKSVQRCPRRAHACIIDTVFTVAPELVASSATELFYISRQRTAYGTGNGMGSLEVYGC